ncbi:hypothetical protein FSP39_010822 [Pinctada imbricata]|uniref:Uncharacterized protein n=1 Tax=Pinctada imbricata TaxID=66713 RepID=A0AA89C1D4_PINIB|nr:hypothetical protein FSP39_010822 [Pinctada imbricata]
MVKAKENVIIPAQSGILLAVQIEESEELGPLAYFEGEQEVDRSRGTVIVPGIVNTKGNVVINIINTSDTPSEVKTNQLVGKCEPYEEKLETERVAKIQENKSTERQPRQLGEHLKELLERSSEHLNETERLKVETLLLKYQNVFSRSSEDIGRTNRVVHRINTGTAIPIRQATRRLPIGKREIEKKELQKMIDRGIVEPSRSPWASNIVLVTKKDGRVRFCVDYRKLNDVTLKDAYPIPRVDDCLEALSGAKWFSSMDLNTGFWQIGMADEDKEKTAFLTSMGLYQFTVMPFGLVNAPSTFERLMEDVLRGLQWQECLVYIDDIISISSDFEEGLQRLERIFLRLQDANMKLKPSKCILFQKKVNFLGHIVSECSISTDPIKVEAVQTWPRPRTPKQVRSFLGLCSYYRRFVQGFADIARPLHKLCEKGAKFVWTEECDSSFENLKQRLCTSPILAYPIPGLPFILDTDASHAAVGAVLSQVQEDAERVISYMSIAMNVHERSYCITRKELLAVITALRSFHSYLYGQEVLLRTDNSAVSWMKNLKRPTGQTARWLEELGTYNLQVIHRPGKSHSNADALSRRPCKSCERQESINQEAIIQESAEEEKSDIQEPKCDTVRVTSEEMNTSRNQAILEGWDPMSLRQKQLEDENIQPIISAFDGTGTRPPWDKVSSCSSILKTLWRQWDRLELIEGVLYRIFHEEDKTSKQIIVPKDLQGNVIKHFHDIPSAGHLGAEKTQSRISRSFYWPNMTETISSYCKTCDKCSARNPPNKSRRAPLGQYLVGEPMERIAVDILGPLPVTAKGNRYVLVICDLFTKWTEAFAIPNQEASTVARVMIDEFICRFGTPLQIHSDQGRTFESQIFQGMCELLQIDKTRTTSQRPQANGCVERFNRTLGAMLTKYAENEQKKWDEYLPQLMMGYRSSTHSSTNATPNLLMLGRNVMMPMDAVIPRPPEPNSSIIENEREHYIRELQTKLTKAHETTRKHLKKSSDYQKKHYDIKSSKRSLEIGQAVWLYEATRKVGVCHKLTSKWKGPYVVVKKIDDLTYMVKRSRKQLAKAYHIDRLLPYKGHNFPKWFTKSG